MERLDALARHSDEPGRLTRLYLSPAHRRASAALSAWMREAGMSVRVDPLATVIGRYEGRTPNLPALLIGSHIDTVRDAGKYDGALGVLAGLTAVEELSRRGERLPFAVEVVAFGDEEGVRFPSTLSSSRALAGTLSPDVLSCTDDSGLKLADALANFGCDPSRIAEAAMPRDSVLAYIEAHIEQGPVLEQMDRPVGIVTAINGIRRMAVTVTGEAGHAGTVPMALRRDSLAAAAEMVLAVEQTGRQHDGVVATVGRIEAHPGAVNVIPGRTTFTIDLRAADDATRDSCVAAIHSAIEAIASRRQCTAEIALMHTEPATTCAPEITAALTRAIEAEGMGPVALSSGAGHDAMAVAALCPVGMLFVRCAGGISHNPAEAITTEDADACMRVLLRFVRSFRAEETQTGTT
jgi:allantoate deiminase